MCVCLTLNHLTTGINNRIEIVSSYLPFGFVIIVSICMVNETFDDANDSVFANAIA